jgi:hypothetical protein
MLAAVDWARGVPRCSLLITQLHGEGVNGLALGARLSDTFAALQTMFLPEYPGVRSTARYPAFESLSRSRSKGERLLSAIARAEEQRQTGMDCFTRSMSCRCAASACAAARCNW